jgi:hypothetical protein
MAVRCPGDTCGTSRYVAGSLIGAGAVLMGSVVTGLREWRVRRAERGVARKTELKIAMREFLAVLDAIMVELSDEPAPPMPTWLDRKLVPAIARLGFTFVFELLTLLFRRAVYGQRNQQLVHRLAAASAHLRLIGPPSVEELMREAETLGRRYQPGDPKWRDEWSAVRARIRTSFREELGEADNARARPKARTGREPEKRRQSAQR